MKLKQHDWTEQERRLETVDSQLSQQDKIVRATLLATAIFGVAALAAVVGYIVFLPSLSGR
jgi:hypothetical protein